MRFLLKKSPLNVILYTQGLLMIFAMQYVLINLVVDMLYGVINPKIRYD